MKIMCRNIEENQNFSIYSKQQLRIFISPLEYIAISVDNFGTIRNVHSHKIECHRKKQYLTRKENRFTFSFEFPKKRPLAF